jgi:hypothetical protein
MRSSTQSSILLTVNTIHPGPNTSTSLKRGHRLFEVRVCYRIDVPFIVIGVSAGECISSLSLTLHVDPTVLHDFRLLPTPQQRGH